MPDAIEAIIEHVCDTGFEDVPASAIEAARIFILDSFGVGLIGSRGPLAAELVEAQSGLGTGRDARVWGCGRRLPAASAAMCNAYQIHNSEFDCIHEEAVVHVMAVVLPVAMAAAERVGNISGKQLLEALVVGTNVAAGLGVAATSGLRFFRPATAGAFGGVAAMCKLQGFSKDQLRDTFSLAYGQLCGTMQAHAEGSMLLATQIGFNARNAVVACDLARAGFSGPRQILEGEFGYFRLFEDGGDIERLISELGRTWRIGEVAHKPFPSGRATHGIIDGCLGLLREHNYSPDAIETISLKVPALVHQLVGRPAETEMTINYARLCAQYVTACALLRNGLTIEDFQEASYSDPAKQELAQRIEIEPYVPDNPNALTPIDVRISLKTGQDISSTISDVYGSPAKPMSRKDHLKKYRDNCKGSVQAIPQEKTEALIGMVDELEMLDDVACLVDNLVP